MIAIPHNDRACLDAITCEVLDRVESEDPRLVAVAEKHGSPEALARWIRSLPQRDDTGLASDGPRVEACWPPQRLRIPTEDPNCVERAALYIGAAELLEPEPVRRLATVDTVRGPHTFPTEDGEPVILDPRQSRNALRGCLFQADRARNGGVPLELTPSEAIEWAVELASEPARRFVGGVRRVQNADRSLRALLVGRPICLADAKDVAFLLALAAREAELFGPLGSRIVQATILATDEIDRQAGGRWMDQLAKTRPRNIPELRIGGLRIKPDMALFGALGRVGGRLGYQVALEALRAKLATLGISAPVIDSVERELKREGLSLGPLASPSPSAGTLQALTPQALATAGSPRYSK